MTEAGKLRSTRLFVLLLVCLGVGCGTLGGQRHQGTQQGEASWYGKQYRGRHTASGERFKPNAMTAAHKTLPFNTIVRVTNLNNGRTVKVRINDRGPFKSGRIIDLSRGAARKVDMVRTGVAPVRLEVLKWGDRR